MFLPGKTEEMASTRKRKRRADESFHKNFVELRDTGVPDTGPKRPKDKRTVSLTPAVSTASQLAQEEASGGGGKTGRRLSRGRRVSRGRGGRRESTGRRRSQEEKTPRTQLKTDIRDLINSAVERGDVTPAPPRAVLTPHTPTPSASPEVEHSTQEKMDSLSTTATVTEIEVRRRAELDSVAETHMTSVLESPALIEETPSDSRVLRSALKGVHSLSSLRKRSLVSHTSHSVTFRDHNAVSEYSPEKGGSDFTLDSSTSSSPPSPLSHTVTSSAAVSVREGPPLEPLEEEDMEEGEGEEGEQQVEEGEKEEKEEEGEGDEVRMQTPHLLPKPPHLSPKETTISSKSVRKQQKVANKHTRKPKHSATDESPVGPPKTLSRTLIKNLFMLSGKRRLTADAADLIIKFSEVYLKRCTQDLATYASHAGRKTVEVDDAVLLMKRQRFISGTETFEYLVNTHLPLEYVEELLPCAVAGKKIVPSRVK